MNEEAGSQKKRPLYPNLRASATVKPRRRWLPLPLPRPRRRRAPTRGPRESSARHRGVPRPARPARRVRRPRPRSPRGPRRGGRCPRRVAPRVAPPARGGHPVAAGLEGVRGRRARARAAPRRRARRRRRAQLLGRPLRPPQFPAPHPRMPPCFLLSTCYVFDAMTVSADATIA